MNAGLVIPSTFPERLEDVRVDTQVDGLLGDRGLHLRIVPEIGGQIDRRRIRSRGAELTPPPLSSLSVPQVTLPRYFPILSHPLSRHDNGPHAGRPVRDGDVAAFGDHRPDLPKTSVEFVERRALAAA